MNRSLFHLVRRGAALGLLVAGAASLTLAQSASAQQTSPSAQPLLAGAPASNLPFLVASSAIPAGLFDAETPAYSSSAGAPEAAAADSFSFGTRSDASQPPPRRRYGRPNYSDSHTNPDGSSKYVFIVGAGLAAPIGNTYKYETLNYGLQFGAGRNFNKMYGVLFQFDYDHFGLQGTNLANQQTIYNYCTVAEYNAGYCAPEGAATTSTATPIDGNNHVWSLTLDPTFSLPTEGNMGAYAVVGGGYYHKVTNFTAPSVQEECYYYCEEIEVNSNIDHYTSNAFGVNAGLGLTYKFSHFSDQRFYLEARYVLILNSQRYGVTPANIASASLAATDFYPANSNRTTYIPVKFGIRF